MAANFVIEPNKKGKAAVWKYFGFIKEKEDPAIIDNTDKSGLQTKYITNVPCAQKPRVRKLSQYYCNSTCTIAILAQYRCDLLQYNFAIVKMSSGNSHP